MIYSNFTGRVAKKAKVIDGVIGKKQEGANAAANAATDTNVPDAPTDTPKEKKDDLPF